MSLSELHAQHRRTIRRGVVQAVAPPAPKNRPAVRAASTAAPPATGYAYRPVLDDDVPGGVLQTAQRTLCDVAASLNLPTGIQMHWYTPCSPEHPHAFTASPELAGFCYSAEKIWINASQGVHDVRRTVAHELRHAWQNRTGAIDDADREPDAYAFADRWMNR